MGVELAFPSFAATCYVEIEEYPRSTLIAGQKAGYLKPAPIWDDLKQFNGRPFRGIVDCILAGYPCQPFSQAGQRKGKEDPRHLWPDIARIIDEVGSSWVILENVAGHVSLGAETVCRDLRRMGFTPAVGLFTAAETGASHERKRWFCLAYSHGNAQQFADSRKSDTGSDGRHYVGGGGGKAVANTGGRRSCGSSQGEDQQPRGTEVVGTISDLVNTEIIGCDEGRSEPSIRGRRCATPSTGDNVAHPASEKFHIGRHAEQPQTDQERATGLVKEPERCRRNVADTSPEGLQRGARQGLSGTEGKSVRHSAECNNELADAIGNAGHQGRYREGGREGREGQAVGFSTHRPNIHPPGPSVSDTWASIIAVAPDLAPSISFGDCKRFADRLAQMVAAGELAETEAESAICRMVDGMAQRSRALKLLGNGVQPLEAATAIRTLGFAHGLRPMDLGADG